MKNLRQVLKQIRFNFSSNENLKNLQENFQFFKQFENLNEEKIKRIKSSVNNEEKECVEQFFNVFYKNASVYDQIQFELFINYKRLQNQDPESVFIDYTYLDKDSIDQGNIVEKFYQQQYQLKKAQSDMLQNLDLSQLGNSAGQQQIQEEQKEEVDPAVNQQEINLQNYYRKFQSFSKIENYKGSQKFIRNWTQRCYIKRQKIQQKKFQQL